MGFFGERLHARGRFYGSLATAIDAGLPIDRALATLAGTGDRFGAQLGTEVSGGRALSEAMAGGGSRFSRFEVLVVEAGERAGRLPEVLRRLGRAFEVRGKARDRLGFSLLYPGVLLHGAVLLPPLHLLFRGGLGAYLGAVVPVLLAIYGVIAAGIWLFRVLRSSETGRRKLDSFALSLPVVSKLARNVALADYAEAFTTLLAAGVPIPETLVRAAEAIRNREMRAAGLRVAESVRAGATIREGLAAESAVFPPVFLQAVAVGESAGRLEESLERAGRAFRRDAEQSLLAFTAALGCVAYAVAALLVAWVVVSFWIGTTDLLDAL